MTGYCYSNEPQEEESSLSAITEEFTVRTQRAELEAIQHPLVGTTKEQSIGAPRAVWTTEIPSSCFKDCMTFFHNNIGEKHKLGDLLIPWSLVYELLSSY